MDISVISQNTDLTENEASVLVYLYENGLSTAYEISKEINIPKVSVTYLLNRLLEKELVERRSEQNTFFFDARSPDKLVEKHDLRITALQKKRASLAETVKKLKQIRNYEASNKIDLYIEKSEITRLRANLIDLCEKDSCKRIFDSQLNIEKYESENAIYIFDLNEGIAMRIEPKSYFGKVNSIFSKLNSS
ncbi:MarR family transcriptional regulator [Candidatus Dojkabacteria bacterium]|uniref:MarR family transcriptional regulator n=1 Tax=Candidatus Dojkabacteria bacterium TaxID=2099670 RepID=A0A955RHT8_9BACT|nr:MarR family transcriptional regulator [Candidatus Dojkabacteria bacterium]